MGRRIIRRTTLEEGTELAPGVSPVLARVYAARDVRRAADLDYSLDRLLPFGLLGGIDRASAILADVLRSDGRILVIGDFDADGATSCALVVEALRSFGCTRVEYLVPNRFEFGYGLSPEIVEVAAGREPAVIVTVDNGISSLEGVAAARSRGISVVVTDHHLPGSRLPEADAIVNPNLPGDPFPSKALAGVGVAFYLMAALRARLRDARWFDRGAVGEPNLAQLLDLVALGTVADVVPLDRNNRILVAQGLRRIRAGRARPGIEALIRVSGRRGHDLVAADLGYALGPRLNAAGRLDDMSIGIECLLADGPVDARRLAATLDALNQERRSLEADMQAQALAHIEAMELAPDSAVPAGLCLFDPQWHQGVVGILASRLKERYHRPVIAFAATTGGELRGSARSVEGLHVRDALDAVAARNPGLITRFGGHAMAAGLSLAQDRFPAFSSAFDQEVRRHLTEKDLEGTMLSDGELGEKDISLGVAESLRAAGPWGQAFPEPVFDGVFEVLRHRLVGTGHLKMLLRLPGSERTAEAIAFNAGEQDWYGEARRVNMAYRLDVNEYRGVRSCQLVAEYLEPVE